MISHIPKVIAPNKNPKAKLLRLLSRKILSNLPSQLLAAKISC